MQGIAAKPIGSNMHAGDTQAEDTRTGNMNAADTHAKGDSVWIAPNATVVGDVALGAGTSVWYGAVVRGDVAPISVGEGSNVQDNAVVHVSPGCPVRLGSGVTVGHAAILHSCEVGDNTLIGMGSIVLDGARIGRDCIVGAGALVTQGTVIPDGTVWFGSPARQARLMTEADIAANRENARSYLKEAARLAAGKPTAGEPTA